ncbi:MAG TPA: ABC transporter ATP-binding protein, partial [Erysipelotrichaceae bacterium]|nr:ABC transporter ATP-binding protein [Erysipelotrichaceae bacterium]
MALLELKNVRRIYKTKNVTTTALKEINFTAEAGEFISIMGESGA